MQSDDRALAKGRQPYASGQVELERLRARCRRQAVVIHTLAELVATFKGRLRAMRADNLRLQAENDRLRGERRAISWTDAQPMTRGEPAEAAIPLGVDAPGVARSVVAQWLGGQVAPPVLETAQLVVSELVTNSVRHSGLPDGEDLVVRVSLWAGRCRVEVEDPGCAGTIEPEPGDPDEAAWTGLHVVRALSERWGVVRAAGGPTRVWAQLPCPAPLAKPPRERASGVPIGV